MFCSKCGYEITDEEKNCTKCGKTVHVEGKNIKGKEIEENAFFGLMFLHILGYIFISLIGVACPAIFVYLIIKSII